MTKNADDFVHPIYGRVVHGVVVDEVEIKAVPDGTKRLNETHGMLFPLADPGPVKMLPPRKSQGPTNGDERLKIDTPEFMARWNTPTLPWLPEMDINSPDYWKVCNSGKTIPYKLPDVADPLERAGYAAYASAVQARAAGLPYDSGIIALHTSP